MPRLCTPFAFRWHRNGCVARRWILPMNSPIACPTNTHHIVTLQSSLATRDIEQMHHRQLHFRRIDWRASEDMNRKLRTSSLIRSILIENRDCVLRSIITSRRREERCASSSVSRCFAQKPVKWPAHFSLLYPRSPSWYLRRFAVSSGQFKGDCALYPFRCSVIEPTTFAHKEFRARTLQSLCHAPD